MNMKKIEFIPGAFPESKLKVTDSYSKTLALLMKAKKKLKVKAKVNDLVLLVTKSGFLNVSGHVGIVRAITEEDYTVAFIAGNVVVEKTLQYNSFLNKSGLCTVGFYTI